MMIYLFSVVIMKLALSTCAVKDDIHFCRAPIFESNGVFAHLCYVWSLTHILGEDGLYGFRVVVAQEHLLGATCYLQGQVHARRSCSNYDNSFSSKGRWLSVIVAVQLFACEYILAGDFWLERRIVVPKLELKKFNIIQSRVLKFLLAGTIIAVLVKIPLVCSNFCP